MNLLRAIPGALALTAALLGQELPGPGELSVWPTRLLFEGRTRSLEIQVRNTGMKEATYRISFQNLLMTEDGSLAESEAFPASAAPLLRFSPRQVLLAAGEAQVVRLQLRKPENLAEGEYRIHLLFRAVPPPEATVPPPGPEQGVRMQLTPVPGLAIPVEVRHGTLKSACHLEQVRLQAGATPQLEAVVVQDGRVGLRGTLKLVALRPGAPEQEVANQDFVHYADLPRQRVRIPIPPPVPPQKPLHSGPLRLLLMGEDGKTLLSSHDLPAIQAGS